MSSKVYEVYFFKKAKPENEEEVEPVLAIEIGFFDKKIAPYLVDYTNTNITLVNDSDDVLLDKEELKKMLDHFKTIEANSSIKSFLDKTYKEFDFENHQLILRAW